ncbi:MAG: YfbK domain-containing protein [Akkermansiaceae bacterium]
MSDELKTYIEPELEARLVALVLGEASAFEAEELERLVAKRVELKACKERLEQIHGVLVAAHDDQDDEKWKLSEDRQGKIFERMEETRREKSRQERRKRARQRAERQGRRKLVMLCAACLVAGMIVIVFQTTFSSKKYSASMASSESDEKMQVGNGKFAQLERSFIESVSEMPSEGFKKSEVVASGGARLESNFAVVDEAKTGKAELFYDKNIDQERQAKLSRALTKLNDSVVAVDALELPPSDDASIDFSLNEVDLRTPAESPELAMTQERVPSAAPVSRSVVANGVFPDLPAEESAEEVMDQRSAGREASRNTDGDHLRWVAETEAEKMAVPVPATPARPGQSRSGAIAAKPNAPKVSIPDPITDFSDGSDFGGQAAETGKTVSRAMSKLEEKQKVAAEVTTDLGDIPALDAVSDREGESRGRVTKKKKGQNGGYAGGLLPGWAGATPAPATKPAPPVSAPSSQTIAGRLFEEQNNEDSEADRRWNAPVEKELAEVEGLEMKIDSLKAEKEARYFQQGKESDADGLILEDGFAMDNEEADFGSGGEVQQDSKGGAIGGGGGDHAIALNLKKKVSESLNGSLAVDRGLEQKEVLRRQSRTATAESGQAEGKDAYENGVFNTATRKFRQALDALPPGTANEGRRKDLEKGLPESLLAENAQIRRTGQYKEARENLKETEEEAKSFQYLEGPIRTSPTMGYEISEETEKARRGLYKGEGYYDLGLYDKALEEYKEVLRNDPYNKAARQGVENITGIKNAYYRAANDQTRAELLMEVDKAWESAVPADSNKPSDGRGVFVGDVDDGIFTEFLFGLEDDDEVTASMAVGGQLSVVSKLDQINVPELKLENATVREALDFLRVRSRELDNTTLDEAKKGVNLVADDKSVLESKLPPLNLKNVSLRSALKSIGDASGNFVFVDEFVVRLGESDDTDPFVADLSKDATIVAKLRQIILPEISLENTTVGDALEFIRLRASELDSITVQSDKKGLGVKIDDLVDPDLTIGELKMSQVPLEVAVREVARQAGLKVRLQDQGVVLFNDPEARKAKSKSGFETPTSEKSDSTFSLNVSDVSFKLTKAAFEQGKRPQAEKVRPEEFVNAMSYDDTRPNQAEKISCDFEQGSHPFLSQRNLMRISMSTASLGRNAGTPLRLTLLLDQSGSMERSDRVESLKRAFALLAAQLTPNDEVTLVGFARSPRLLAERVKGNEVAKLAAIIANPLSEGGTNLEEALSSGIQLAKQQFVKGAQNRIILLTDGAANLGDAKPETLVMQVDSIRKAGISFDTCGVGAEGLNDDILSSLAKKGDGRYYFLNRPEDADEGFARQIAGSLRPAAKNVKVQMLFNPDRVTSFKLYGFEKHKLNKEDFRNDKVDAAEMAAEESGVALYHFEPNPEGRGDVGTVSVRFLDTSSNQVVERTWVIPYEEQTAFFNEADPKLRLAGVAGLFAERLKGSPVGERVELKLLRQEMSALKSRFGSQSRFGELETMLRQAGE